jgi:hypothetical protein
MAKNLRAGLRQSLKASRKASLTGQYVFSFASLDLRFALQKTLDPRVTFTRASSATFIDSAGTLQTAAVDVPRFDHNPTTGGSLGLLVEEQRTNSIRNNTMVGAVAGTPGTPPTNWNQSNNTGLAANVVGTGTENGITYIDFRINGTTTGTGQTNIVFETATGVPALTGQAWTLTNYIKVQAGSTANFTNIRLVLQENTSAGVAVVSGTQNMTIPVTPLGSYRPSFTRTLSGGATVAALMPFIQCNINTGLAVDITLRIGLPQLELGAFATSAIPTSTAAATRSAEVASITGSAFSSWYRQDEGTMFARYSFPQSPNTGGARVFVFSNFAATNIIWLRAQGGVNRVYDVTDASVSQATFNQGAYAAGVEYRAALATKANDFGFAENGGAPQSDSSGTMPSAASAETDSLLLEDSPFNDFYILGYGEASSSGVGVDRLGIGVDASGTAPGNVHIRRLTYWPQRLPNSTLVALTQ